MPSLRDSLGPECVFSWDFIPGYQMPSLRDFRMRNFKTYASGYFRYSLAYASGYDVSGRVRSSCFRWLTCRRAVGRISMNRSGRAGKPTRPMT